MATTAAAFRRMDSRAGASWEFPRVPALVTRSPAARRFPRRTTPPVGGARFQSHADSQVAPQPPGKGAPLHNRRIYPVRGGGGVAECYLGVGPRFGSHLHCSEFEWAFFVEAGDSFRVGRGVFNRRHEMQRRDSAVRFRRARYPLLRSGQDRFHLFLDAQPCPFGVRTDDPPDAGARGPARVNRPPVSQSVEQDGTPARALKDVDTRPAGPTPCRVGPRLADKPVAGDHEAAACSSGFSPDPGARFAGK